MRTLPLLAILATLSAISPVAATPPAYQLEHVAKSAMQAKEEKWLKESIPIGTSLPQARSIAQSAGYSCTDGLDAAGRKCLVCRKKTPLRRPWDHLDVVVSIRHERGVVVQAEAETSLSLGRRVWPWQWFPVYELLFEK